MADRLVWLDEASSLALKVLAFDDEAEELEEDWDEDEDEDDWDDDEEEEDDDFDDDEEEWEELFEDDDEDGPRKTRPVWD